MIVTMVLILDGYDVCRDGYGDDDGGHDDGDGHDDNDGDVGDVGDGDYNFDEKEHDVMTPGRRMLEVHTVVNLMVAMTTIFMTVRQNNDDDDDDGDDEVDDEKR